MSPTVSPEPSDLSDSEMHAALAEHGIARVSTDTFHYGGYRYTSIKDAIAEAKRHPEKRSTP